MCQPCAGSFVCLNEAATLKLMIKFCPFTTLDPGGVETTHGAPRDQSPEEEIIIISRQLTEQSRFAYAALCGVSLGQLFTGPENR